MATIEEMRGLATSTPFLFRVSYLLTKTAGAVMLEADTVPDHAARLAFSNRVLSGQVEPHRIALCVLTIPQVAAMPQPGNIKDDALEAAITAIFNHFARAWA